VAFTLFTHDLFATGNDIDNRAAVRVKHSAEQQVVGMAMRDKKKKIDRIVKGLSLHP
jgi:hypothetical protein